MAGRKPTRIRKHTAHLRPLDLSHNEIKLNGRFVKPLKLGMDE